MNYAYPSSYQNNRWHLPPRRWVITAMIALALLLVFLWVKNHGFLEVRVLSPSGTGSYNYTLTNQATGQKTVVTTSASSIKKLVAAGTYEITVQRGESNYFAVRVAPSFLRTGQANSGLQAERARQFVGNNPAGCMHYSGSLLVSYECTGLFSTATVHVAATADQPTYTRPATSPQTFGYTEGFVTTGGRQFLLVRVIHDADQGSSTAHTLYTMTSNLTASGQTVLRGTDPDTSYAIQPYKDGFLLYNEGFSQLLYYSSPDASPVRLAVEKPASGSLSASALSAQGDTLVLLYSSASGSEASGGDQASEAVVYRNDAARHYRFGQLYSSAYACGSYLCLLGNHALDVYSAEDGEPQFLYSVHNISSAMYSNSTLWLATDTGIVTMNAATGYGHYAYSFGTYQSCGTQPAAGGLLLCVISAKGDKSAIYLEQATADTANIDKKVAALQLQPEVSSISVYGTYIFVVPDVGDIQYDQATQAYDYSQGKRTAARQSLQADAARLGISNPYTIVDTLP